MTFIFTLCSWAVVMNFQSSKFECIFNSYSPYTVVCDELSFLNRIKVELSLKKKSSIVVINF